MFAVILRIAAGLAIGGAAVLWITRQRRERTPVRPTSDELQNADIDEAVEDTFPASDPPAFMQSVIAGPPARGTPAEEDTAEAHPS